MVKNIVTTIKIKAALHAHDSLAEYGQNHNRMSTASLHMRQSSTQTNNKSDMSKLIVKRIGERKAAMVCTCSSHGKAGNTNICAENCSLEDKYKQEVEESCSMADLAISRLLESLCYATRVSIQLIAHKKRGPSDTRNSLSFMKPEVHYQVCKSQKLVPVLR